MKNLFDPRYIQAAIQGLNQARITKGEGIGLFSATRFNPDKCKTKLTSGESQENANNYSLAWVRDTLKCSLYDFLAENYIQSRLTISTLIKYFRKNTGIIDLTIDSYHRKESLRHDLHVIMPRMHPITLAPVHADKAKDLQLDMAEILKYIALLTYKNVWTPSCFDEISIIEKLIRYFLAWNYSLNSKIPGDFGIWEEGRGGTTGSAIPEIHTSTIGAMVSGLLAINGCRMKAPNNTFYTISVDESEISKGISLVNDRLITVGETESRKYDLASLITGQS